MEAAGGVTTNRLCKAVPECSALWYRTHKHRTIAARRGCSQWGLVLRPSYTAESLSGPAVNTLMHNQRVSPAAL
jgi:hypothetical protein